MFRTYKVCQVDGTCSDAAIIDAILQAAMTDAVDVINMSLGSTDFSQLLCDTVGVAWSEGVVTVAGAGNNGSTAPFYPASCPDVVSVGAFDEDHRQAPFSNYGNLVHMSAPGNVIFSAYPLAACGGSSTVPGDTGCYTWLSGTSMASPHVAGAAALIWSRPDVTSNSQVVDILFNSADPIGVDPSGVPLGSWTLHGGLNLHDALSYGSTNLSPVAVAGPDQTVPDTKRKGVERVTLDGTASYDPDLDGSIVGYEWSEGGTVIGSSATESVWFSVGTHTITLEVTDDLGATDTDGVDITVGGGGGDPPPPPPPPPGGVTVTEVDPEGPFGLGVWSLTITGTGFQLDASVTLENGSGPAPQVLGVTPVSLPNSLSVDVEIGSGGPPKERKWDVRVTNPDGSTGVGVDLLRVFIP